MNYQQVVEGIFLARPNRFIAQVKIGGIIETVHVKNTGRCRELLIPGCRVWLERAAKPARKTKYDLIAVEKQRPGLPPLLINMDAQAPNAAAEEWLRCSGLFSPQAVIRREVTHQSSRFDFYIEDDGMRTFLEVKGVTLEQDGVVMFPDAPTQRGVRHVEELIQCRAQGIRACILFVVQMEEARCFRPNDAAHPAFGDALRRASQAGVEIFAVKCRVTPDEMVMTEQIPVIL